MARVTVAMVRSVRGNVTAKELMLLVIPIDSIGIYCSQNTFGVVIKPENCTREINFKFFKNFYSTKNSREKFTIRYIICMVSYAHLRETGSSNNDIFPIYTVHEGNRVY